jgi:DNA-directed RNA polymerase specialized sigma24 family protein
MADRHPDRHAVLDGVASRAAARYARRVFWADAADLKQEAMVAALTATRPDGPYDEACGVPLTAYAWRACMLHLRAYCWRQSSPVSETDHRLQDLRGVFHKELLEGLDPYEDFSSTPPTDDLLAMKVWHEDVRAQLDHVLAPCGEEKRVALRVLLDEEPPRRVAQEFDLPVTRVYRIARRARLLLSENAMLFSLWEDT